MERDLRLHWHIVSLSDYWREGYIPRGLRIAKFPAFGSEDKVFKTKWECILNKCSMDLILLLIEEAKTERDTLKKQLQDIKTSMSQVDSIQQLPFEDKLNSDLKKLETTIKQMKLRKFKRDEEDYSRDQVYLWDSDPDAHAPTSIINPRHVTEGSPSI